MCFTQFSIRIARRNLKMPFENANPTLFQRDIFANLLNFKFVFDRFRVKNSVGLDITHRF